jgi:hypothetical protein
MGINTTADAPKCAQKRAVASSLLEYISAKEKSQSEILKHPIIKGIVIAVNFLKKRKRPTKRIKIAEDNDKIEWKVI